MARAKLVYTDSRVSATLLWGEICNLPPINPVETNVQHPFQTAALAEPCAAPLTGDADLLKPCRRQTNVGNIAASGAQGSQRHDSMSSPSQACFAARIAFDADIHMLSTELHIPECKCGTLNGGLMVPPL